MKNKILIFIITYKAKYRVLDVVKKIPFKYFNKKKYKILISDDNSRDNTIEFIRQIKKKYKKKIVINLNNSNLGYGKHIKKCINYAYKNKFSHAVMIHGDNQYDPKYSSTMIENLLKNKNLSATAGSRMLNKINALKGKMPLYKFVGNIILTEFFNFLYLTKFTDCHTGYWSYNLNNISQNTFRKLDDGFCFDIDLRLKLISEKKMINEIPIKTFYGTERSSIHLNYAIRFFFKCLIFKIFK